MASDPHLLQPSVAPASAYFPALDAETPDVVVEEEPAPLVICEGFLCATSHTIWGSFTDELHLGERASRHSRTKGQAFLPPSLGKARKPRRAILAPIGPVSSLHDRACELFYALRGGVVDYGEEHSRKHRHSRFGRKFDTALLPGWGEAGGPRAHFLGHSMGGTTIVELRSLLLRGFFDEALTKGERVDSATKFAKRQAALAAIISVTTVSSPLRGTPLVHILGTQPNTAEHQVRTLSLGNALAKACHLTTWARGAVPRTKAWLPDLHADAWDFAGPFGVRRAWGLPSLAKNLWRSTWAEGDDCAPWDCAIVRRLEVEGEGFGWGPDGPDAWGAPPCFLRAYAASLTEPEALLAADDDRSEEKETGRRAAFKRILNADYSHGPLSVTARMLERYDYASLDVMREVLSVERMTGARLSIDDDGDDQAIEEDDEATLSSARASTDSLDAPLHEGTQRRRSSAALSSTLAADSGYGSEVHTPVLRAKRTEVEPADKGRAIVKLAEELKARLSREWHLRKGGFSSDEGSRMAESADEARRKREEAELLASWRANDGVVPLASQLHPGPCAPEWCQHQRGLGPDLPLPPLSPAPSLLVSTARMLGAQPLLRLVGRDDSAQLPSPPGTEAGQAWQAPAMPSLCLLTPRAMDPLPKPDVWHSVLLPATSHTSLCPFWTGSDAQRLFWRDVGAWLESVEVAAGLA